MASSPWGKIDFVRKYSRGVRFVSTPGHGGFLISKGVAEKRLTQAARNQAERYGDYYAFEEDCAYHIVALELPETRSANFSETDTRKSLSRYFPVYLQERGLAPDKEAFEDFLEYSRYLTRRAAKDPTLVISARGDEGDKVTVWTADGAEYQTTAASYDAARAKLKYVTELTDLERLK